MNKTITMTTKGTFTLPAEIRKQLNVSKKGDKLAISFDQTNKTVTIYSPIGLDQIQEDLAPYVAGKKPIKDASGYYANRKPRV